MFDGGEEKRHKEKAISTPLKLFFRFQPPVERSKNFQLDLQGLGHEFGLTLQKKSLQCNQLPLFEFLK